MSQVNWDTFAALPGAATHNFETLCRQLIRRHYGQYGYFRALANQPGVEFHLKLHSPCSLGDAGHWYGWQCRWYNLLSGTALRTAQRRKIKEALDKTKDVLPELTDWVLWTRHPLTKSDQEWFYGLNTHAKLTLWTTAEVEEHLSGPAEILRGTYFGQLVLTPTTLVDLHSAAVAPIKNRWLPEAHQVVETERELRRTLAESNAWSDLSALAVRLDTGIQAVSAATKKLPSRLSAGADTVIQSAISIRDSLLQTMAALDEGDFEILRQELAANFRPINELEAFSRRLRSARHVLALHATNLLADIYKALSTRKLLNHVLTRRLLVIVAAAGYGKTQLAAQLTSPTKARLAGMLLHGRDLQSGQNLDDLARRQNLNGAPVQTFEALVAALDAAAQRAKCRLPIVIDGLNEADDPRNWKPALASVQTMLRNYSHVVLICTLRPDFQDALPDNAEQLTLDGFQFDLDEAVARYFEHYRIDHDDASLHWELFSHPLLLRMFCEVTNPKREKTVGVEAMPTSLTALFNRYLSQVAARIREFSHPSQRYFEPDVQAALNRIGLALWDAKARSIDKDELRRLLKDDQRSWDKSIVRALEDDGVLIRLPGYGLSPGNVSVVYDLLAGHIVADSLLNHHSGNAFPLWLDQDETTSRFSMDYDKRHPLSHDVFRALVGLCPRRRYGQQLWPLVKEPLQAEALCEAAWLEPHYLDGETVAGLANLTTKFPTGRRDLFDRLWMTRAARNHHPLDSEFLDKVLRAMSVPDRDLRWTEWIRDRRADILDNMLNWQERWRQVEPGQPLEKRRARWVMWTLTSTVRLLRDHATKTLYIFGCNDPVALFELTLDSLNVNDPYVPERMLAASYGIAMSLWADPLGQTIRVALPGFANELVERMFVPSAPLGTRHALMRDYALSIIALARKLAPGCIADDKLHYLKPPFEHLSSPFPALNVIADSDIADAKGAIHMDFGNYTIGGLVPHRRNYDHQHPGYESVRRQIEARIVNLGYSASRFQNVDMTIGRDHWRPDDANKSKVDRYGKKYSWIAYFEMYGLLNDQGDVTDQTIPERISDADIDPSFPEPPRTWRPTLRKIFKKSTRDLKEWIGMGPTPDYDHLLSPAKVDDRSGPWALLEGFIEESALGDDRQVFTFLRGVFVSTKRAPQLLSAFRAQSYPGNHAIPDPLADYYTYAGEISWSERFGSNLRAPNGEPLRDERNAFEHYARSKWKAGIPIEIPVCRFAWESYHSQLNQVDNVDVPAPALCQHMGLVIRRGEWDLYDANGKLASIYRKFKDEPETINIHLRYIRSDLLADYLETTGQVLVWLRWGERRINYRAGEEVIEQLRGLFRRNLNIHRQSSCWSPKVRRAVARKRKA